MTGYLLRSVRDPRGGDPRDARIRDGRIFFGEDTRPLPGEEVIDAQGRWLIPGLWDAHVHFDQWARARSRADLSGAASPDEALDVVRRGLEAAPGSGVYFGFGYRSSAWERQPTVAELDAVTGERPVVLISGDMHNGWLNSAALAAVGARPTEGPLTENDWFPLYTRLEEHLPDVNSEIPRALREAASRGVVGIVDLEFAANHRVWPERIVRGLDTLRVRTGVYPDLLPEVVDAGLSTGTPLEPTGLARMGPLKIISDGSLGTRTAYCCEPYAPSPHPRGVRNVAPDEMIHLIERARDAGLEVALHAIGDAAVRDALAAFGSTSARGSIEHAQLMRREDLAEMAALGLTASVQPAHLLDDRDVTDRLWADRADRCFMLDSMARAGIPLALGSDAPVSALDPWLAMSAAVCRSSGDREPWHQEEAIGAARALRSSTDGVEALGSGDVADCALVDANPFGGRDAQEAGRILRDMTVSATFLGGRPTHLTI